MISTSIHNVCGEGANKGANRSQEADFENGACVSLQHEDVADDRPFPT